MAVIGNLTAERGGRDKMRDYKRLMAFAAAGYAAMAGQVLAMRELMAALRGNELALAATLAAWLTLTGLFSWAGTRLTRLAQSRGWALPFSLFVLALVLPLAVLVPRLLPPLLGIAPGEAYPAGVMFILIIATLSLITPVVGLTFPIAVSASDVGRPGGAPAVYAFEALGGFAAGLFFTLIASRLMGPFQAASTASLVCLVSSAALSHKSARVLSAASAAFTVFPVLLFIFAPHLELFTENRLLGVGRVVEAAQSRYGVVTVHRLPGQYAVYEGGVYGFSIPDRDMAEKKAHLPMTLHADPRDVLLIGGGGGGVVAEALKHPVKSLDYVELDPRLIEVSARYMTDEDKRAFEDPRVRAHFTDGRSFVKKSVRAYDLIMVSLPEPSTAAVNRYYTVEFFEEAARALKPGGIFSVCLPSSPNYIGRRQQALNGSVYHTMQAVFPYVRVTPEDTNYFFGSMDGGAISFDAAELARRFEGRGVVAKSFNRYTLPYSLQPGRVAYVEERLSGHSGLGINRDFRPAAYLYSLGLWGDVAGLPAFDWLAALKVSPARLFIWPVLILLASIPMFYLFLRGRLDRKASFAIVTTGFSGMVLEVAILLAFQSVHGYLYEAMGLLMAFFMLGLFLGSRAGAGTLAGKRRPAGLLLSFEACFVLLALFISLTTAFPDALLSGASLYLSMLFAGFLTGAEYPAALAASGYGNGPQAEKDAPAGRLYGLDLMGSGAGALLSGLVLIPLLGIAFTALFVLLLKAVSAGFLLTDVRKT